MSNNLCWPLKINTIRCGRMGTFGMVRNNRQKAHNGWDLYAYPGITCHAVDDGVVMEARYSTDYGYLVDIQLDTKINGEKVYARYAHLSGFVVKEKTRVARGEIIGFTGNSGNARGMTGIHQHLHFELMNRANPPRSKDDGGRDGLRHRYDPALVYGVLPLAPTKVIDPFLNKQWEPDDGRTIPPKGETAK
jgi:murein DD-endopeptidase MepM/ murein hydrolase activator NlpD